MKTIDKRRGNGGVFGHTASGAVCSWLLTGQPELPIIRVSVGTNGNGSLLSPVHRPYRIVESWFRLHRFTDREKKKKK